MERKFSDGWSKHRKRARRHCTRNAISTSIIATLSYLSVLLLCSHPDGKYLGWSVVQSFSHAIVASTAPDHDTHEELCKVVHKEIVALQAFSIGPILGAQTLHLDIAIREGMARLIARLAAFRPPGDRFAPVQVVNFQLSSVLRI